MTCGNDMAELKFDHVYVWKNNEKRLTLYNKRCRIISHGKKNSVLIYFEDGHKEVTSRWAVRKIKYV